MLEFELPTDRELINAVMDWEVTKWKIVTPGNDLIMCQLDSENLICLSNNRTFMLITYCSKAAQIIAYCTIEKEDFDYYRYLKFWERVEYNMLK